MKEYEKIETIFKRDLDTKKIIEGQYRNKTIEYLKDCIWEFSEKVDGTNIRVVWDGHKVMFYGRTDKAQIPSFLLTKLQELFGGNINEEIFEQLFGASQVVLYGEGYGAKIQNGGGYRDDVSFILFDIEINGIYLERESVVGIAEKLKIEYVPILFSGTLQEGVDYVKQHPSSYIAMKDADMEGLVARPQYELKDRLGNRIIVKIKYRDFKEN